MRPSPYYATVLAVIRHFFFLCGRLAPSCGSCSTLFSCGAVGTVASHHIMTTNQQWKSLQCPETRTAPLPQTAPCRRPCLSMWFVGADSPCMYREVGPQRVPQLVKQLLSRGTVVGYHAQMTMSGRVPTGIAADGGASPRVVRAPLATAFFFLILHGHLFSAFASTRRPATLVAMRCHAQAS